VTQCCSDFCAKRYYKIKQKESKIEKSNVETQTTLNLPMETIKAKEFLSVVETGKLLGISTRTLYRLMANGELKFGKVGKRTIIKKTDLDTFFKN
jgi:excisionase family DNA binding protein